MTVQQVREAKLAEHLDQTIQTFRAQAEKAGKLMDSLDTAVNDPKLRGDLKESMASFRAAADTAARVATNVEKFSTKIDTIGENFNAVATNANTTITKTQGHIDDLSKRMDDRLLEVSKLLQQFQSIAAKVDDGKGTAGMLVNDAKLYESLVNTSKELNLTITDLKLLVKQWTDEGVYIKLNK